MVNQTGRVSVPISFVEALAENSHELSNSLGLIMATLTVAITTKPREEIYSSLGDVLNLATRATATLQELMLKISRVREVIGDRG